MGRPTHQLSNKPLGRNHKQLTEGVGAKRNNVFVLDQEKTSPSRCGGVVLLNAQLVQQLRKVAAVLLQKW